LSVNFGGIGQAYQRAALAQANEVRMATTVEAKIAEALFAKLEALVFSPVLPIAWTNKAFTPPADGKWLRASDIPASTEPYSLSGASAEIIGLLQVDVFWPLNRGLAEPKDIAGAIVAHFRPPTDLFLDDGTRVRTTRASIAPHLIDGQNIMLPVTIRYRCFGR
jgi:hypothetical protein